MNAQQIIEAIEEIALLLELNGENPFRVRAYNNAARILSNLDEELPAFIAKAQNGEIKGIGPALTDTIAELHQKGSSAFLNQLRKKFPANLLDLLKVPGLGAKKVKALYEELDIADLVALEAACKDGSVAKLTGFGEKTAAKILAGIERIKTYQGLFRISQVIPEANFILEQLKNSKLCDDISVAGSLRRRKEIVKDIDLVATSKNPEKLMEKFINLENVASVTGHGETKSSVVLKNNIAVDLRVVSTKEFASALCHFTGSKEHNTVLRSLAIKKGLKLNEYGLFKGEKALNVKSEADLYQHLGLAFIPPEMREANEEIEYAAKLFKEEKELPELVEADDLKGIIHAHSTYSDGVNTLADLAAAVKKMGYQYLGITDHSQSAAYASGLTPDRVKRQQEEIDQLNEQLKPFRILKGIESDILPDGSLDYKEKVLESFDFIIASVHSNFNMSEKEMTARVIKAIQNPYTTILGHPTGRLLLQRDGYPIDLNKIIEAAAESNVAIEINANPYRLDLDWRYVRKAVEHGIKIPICPDAHDILAVNDINYGIGTARKGWLTKENVLNCLSLKELEKYLLKKRNGK